MLTENKYILNVYFSLNVDSKLQKKHEKCIKNEKMTLIGHRYKII